MKCTLQEAARRAASIGLLVVGVAQPVACLAAGSASGQPANVLSPEQTQAVQALIGPWLLAHPDQLRAALGQNRDLAQAKPSAVPTASPATPTQAESSTIGDGRFGSTTADVTIEVYLDRASQTGADVLSTLFAVLAADPRLAVTVHELPLLSAGGVATARVAAAAAAQGSTARLRWDIAWMALGRPLTSEGAAAAGDKAGLDGAKLRADAASAATLTYLKDIRRRADELGIRGTPTFLVGAHALVGAQSAETLRIAVATARLEQGHSAGPQQ